MRTALRRSTFLSTAVFAAFMVAPAYAQDVQYKTVTKLDMGGAMNVMMRIAGASETTETTYLKGAKMRTDMDNVSSIMDLEARRYITLDHKAKTFTSVPFEQMAEVARVAVAQVQAQANVQADQSQGQTRVYAEEGHADFKFDLKIDPTNERQRINGQDAQRLLMTMKTDMSVTPEGETKAEDVGTLVVLVDTWNATDGAVVAAYENFQKAAVNEARQAFRGGFGLQAAFAQNPQMGEAMAKAAEEAQKMEGITVRSVTHLVLVPAGIEFDRDAVLNPPAANRAGAARGLARGALGRAIGGQRHEEAKPDDDQPRQATFMKMTTEIRDLQSKSLPASLFEVPAGYREVPWNSPAGN